MSEQSDIRSEVDGGLARLVLDRPRAINALTPDMMDEISRLLHAWADDDQVTAVEIRGEGERGFCAGADVRAIRQLCLDEPAAADRFFEVEYRVNALVAHFPKPITSHLYGIAMGGGLGLGLHCSRVVATDDLQLAMPETGIGLFPDVGITHQLSHAPGELGTWLALTGTTIDASSARFAGLVDEVVDATGRPVADDGADSRLAEDQEWIDACFTGDDAAAIVDRLAARPETRARECADLIRSRSPWSVCVALEAVRRAVGMDVDGVLAQDLVLARNFVVDSDFVEGVRAQLVDKDRTPHWRHAGIEDVPRDLVASMFQPRG